MVSTVYSSDPANTPNVLYTYDEYARPVTVSQIRNGAGPSPLLASCSYTYNPTTLVIDTETVSYDTDADGTIDFSRVIDRDQDSILRPSNCELRDGNTTEHTVAYSYDSSSRLSTVTGNGLAHTYGYTPNSYSLLASVTSPSHTVSNIYEPTRNVLATKENSVASGTSVVSKYAYTVNSIGQRTNLATTGTAFTSNIALAWSYNAAGEVVAADHSDNSQDRAFQYDGIGNRQKSADSLTLPGVSNYTVNSLNQYTAVPSLPSVLTYDEDGNATSYPLPSEATSNAQLIWDAENRLIAVVKANNSTVYYSYDAQSRRTSKQIDTTPAIYYIYDGWNMIADYSIVNSSFTILNSYTWGMDMSGSMQGAGGVGGLLQVTDHSSPSTDHYFPTYDGNGNVSEYLSTAGAVVAHYEYDTFGNEIVAATSGSLAQNFSHRFSTKYIDAETGFYYYGYRYYDPTVGRFINRDPIKDLGSWATKSYTSSLSTLLALLQGGAIYSNPYLYIANRPINAVEVNGEWALLYAIPGAGQIALAATAVVLLADLAINQEDSVLAQAAEALVDVVEDIEVPDNIIPFPNSNNDPDNRPEPGGDPIPPLLPDYPRPDDGEPRRPTLCKNVPPTIESPLGVICNYKCSDGTTGAVAVECKPCPTVIAKHLLHL